MSALTHQLRTARPSRALCLKAAARIEQLEDGLIDGVMLAMKESRADIISSLEKSLTQPKE